MHPGIGGNDKTKNDMRRQTVFPGEVLLSNVKLVTVGKSLASYSA